MGDQNKWIIRLVSAMWAANLAAGMIPPLKYEPSEAVNGIFMAIVGGLFLADRTIKRENKDEKEAPDQDKELQ